LTKTVCWAGGLLLARSTAAMLCLTLATSLAAKEGAIPMAAHQICMQTWLAASLLSDAIALAGQVHIFPLTKSTISKI
jgi:Na+-driven multidrug efflux pump